MCGIAGIMTVDGAAPALAALDAMQAALHHRGPDGVGRHLGDGIGLVHTRLAIIDLETGDQPIISPDGTALIANAEIYNYLELRETLTEAPLQTQSDCEPALYLYNRDGIDFANKLRGMYAIAIHDPGEGQLLLARDPFGIKPLYYVEGSFGFAFASEPTALIKAGLVRPGLVEQPLHEMLQMQFTTGRESIHSNIHRVLPGETLVIAQGRIVDRRRRAALPLAPPRRLEEAAALVELEQVLLHSVEVHQRSDVPYGMFLSGGIDSSALLTRPYVPSPPASPALRPMTSGPRPAPWPGILVLNIMKSASMKTISGLCCPRSPPKLMIQRRITLCCRPINWRRRRARRV
jgi:asparagine synthase (glutamine-hydrolysing)